MRRAQLWMALTLTCAGSGCVKPTVMMTRNVTVPVMYGPVRRTGDPAAERGTLKRRFSVKARSYLSVSTHEDDYYRTTTSSTEYEGSNKFDAVILSAQGTCPTCPVHIDKIKIGAYHSFLIYGLEEGNWIRLEGGVYAPYY